MAAFKEMIKSADWKSEKHVPVISAPQTVSAGEVFEVRVTLGKEVAHPNTTEHHIRWMSLYFQPEKGNAYHVARVEFCAHGESTAGANEGPVYANHEAVVSMKSDVPGKLVATSYCNIHGVWESDCELAVN